jgi:hypothetical protein
MKTDYLSFRAKDTPIPLPSTLYDPSCVLSRSYDTRWDLYVDTDLLEKSEAIKDNLSLLRWFRENVGEPMSRPQSSVILKCRSVGSARWTY